MFLNYIFGMLATIVPLQEQRAALHFVVERQFIYMASTETTTAEYWITDDLKDISTGERMQLRRRPAPTRLAGQTLLATILALAGSVVAAFGQGPKTEIGVGAVNILKRGLTCGLFLFVILLSGPSSSTVAQQGSSKCSPDSDALVSVATVLNIFKDAKDSFWPGYDLSTRPVLFYSAGRWSLLINATSSADRFEPYQLGDGSSLQLNCGSLEGLAGQLELNYQLGKETTMAIPFVSREVAPQTPVIVTNLAIIVHEAFHQFQRGRFAVVPSRSEEEYPILNEENNALAALETRILADAVSEQSSGRAGLWRKTAAMFVAVHDRRLSLMPTVVREIERVKEFDEGTAYYVEVRSIERMAALCSTRRASGIAAQACSQFTGLDGTA